MSDSYHYQTIARAIAEIDAANEPLSLEQLAGRMGMSEAHFQRVFTRWAGVSPKKYQQYLTLGHAKGLLKESTPLMDTAHATGLSGSSRLHDLFLSWEAMTPGQYAKKGEGLVIGEAVVESPYGPVVAMATNVGLCALGFAAEQGVETVRVDLRGRWPAARFEEDARVGDMARAALEQSGRLKLHLMGGAFQVKVWEALLAIPEGQLTTYGDLAAVLGKPGASRAVGTAVGANPISGLIPCHRVLRKDGAMGGYHWGVPVKRAILARESARAEA